MSETIKIDWRWEKRVSLAENPALDQHPELAARLTADPHWAVRAAFAQNPALAQYPALADKLVADPQPIVRHLAMKNLKRISEEKNHEQDN